MASAVLRALRANKEYMKERADDQIPTFATETGFQLYDYMTSQKSVITGPNDVPQRYLNMGLGPGTSSIIAKSGVGKTSFALKIAMNIVRQYEDSVFYIRDAENTFTYDRAAMLTGCSVSQLKEKIDLAKYGIDHDFVFNDIRRICQYKESLRNDIMIETGKLDETGKPIKIFPPDVYLLDSLPELKLLNDDEELTVGSRATNAAESYSDIKVNRRVEGMQAAGSTKLLLNKVNDLLFKYNIRLLLINHIVKPTNTLGVNPMYIAKQMQFLNQDESLPGGVSYLYHCINITKFVGGGRIDGDFGSMFDGVKNKMIFVKNKQNVSGIPIEVIYDQRSGYNSILTTFNYLYNRGYGMEGNPRSLNFVDSNISFTKKTFWERLCNEFKEYGDRSPLLRALLYIGNRCMYYDFTVGQPDPDPHFWGAGRSSRLDMKRGLTS